MSRFHYKTKLWEGIPDKEKYTIKNWSKNAHVENNDLLKNIISNRKLAERMLLSLAVLDSNITCFEHELNNTVAHLKTLLHFGASGKLAENYRNSGYLIKKKLGLVIGIFYNVPLVSSKQLRLKSDRPTIKYYRDFYTLLQHSEIEIQNQLTPDRSKLLTRKLTKIKQELDTKLENCKLRISTLKFSIKNSPQAKTDTP